MTLFGLFSHQHAEFKIWSLENSLEQTTRLSRILTIPLRPTTSLKLGKKSHVYMLGILNIFVCSGKYQVCVCLCSYISQIKLA